MTEYVKGKLYRAHGYNKYFFAVDRQGKWCPNGTKEITLAQFTKGVYFIYLGEVKGVLSVPISTYHLVLWDEMVGIVDAFTVLKEVTEEDG